MEKIVLILTTEASHLKAVELARSLLKRKLAACVNLRSIESHYWWEGNLEAIKEVQLLIKTSPSLVADLCEVINEQHSYTTPEIIELNCRASNEYIDWLESSVSCRKSGSSD